MKRFLKENFFYVITMLVVVLAFQIRLPYYINTPGGTIDISDRIEMEGLAKYDGSLNMLYVTEYVATIPTYLLSYVIRDWDLEEISTNQISDESPEEIEVRNKIMLDNSINNAIYVAYTAAKREIKIKSQKNLVVGTTFSNGLKIGDEILKIDGEEIKDANAIKEVISSHQKGDSIVFLVKRQDKEQEVSVKVQEENGRNILGVVIVTNYEYEVNPEVSLKFRSSESGSSGGLMMALSIYNAISGEDILKGRNIAGTGTIDILGNVGEIAGIKYKIMGAVHDKMDVVLVPSENYEEAKKVVREKKYDIEIVEVKTFLDAVRYLKEH